jgi:hypothetical protein
MRRGPYLVDPGLSWIVYQQGLQVSDDDEARCLAYLIKMMDEIVNVPQDLTFEVFSMFGKTGGRYPAIAMFTENSTYSEEYLFDLAAITLSDRLMEAIEEIGVGELLEKSVAESLSWDEVLQKYGEASPVWPPMSIWSMTRHDFEAELHFYPPEEGGKDQPVFQGYKPDFHYLDDPESVGWIIHPRFVGENGEELPSEVPIAGKVLARMYIVSHEHREKVHRGRLREGLRFIFREGHQTVAEGIVIKVLDHLINENG